MKERIIRIDLNGVNCYLVKSNEGFILFDTGGPMYMDRKFNGRQDDLVKELEKAGCFLGNLKLVVLTHGDIDHVFNTAYIREKYNVKIALHHGDLPFVENPTVESFLKSSQFRSAIYKIMSKLMRRYMHNLSTNAIAYFNKFSPDILIDKNFSLMDFGLEAEILHIPGHTDGSICILFKDGSLICGDTFFNMFKPSIAVNACDYQELDKSIRGLQKYNLATIYPGHGKPFHFNRISI